MHSIEPFFHPFPANEYPIDRKNPRFDVKTLGIIQSSVPFMAIRNRYWLHLERHGCGAASPVTDYFADFLHGGHPQPLLAASRTTWLRRCLIEFFLGLFYGAVT